PCTASPAAPSRRTTVSRAVTAPTALPMRHRPRPHRMPGRRLVRPAFTEGCHSEHMSHDPSSPSADLPPTVGGSLEDGPPATPLRAVAGNTDSFDVEPPYVADNDAVDLDLEGYGDRFADRELSWLRFNQRVLELAEDPDLPLLERARFSAIFTSNLDEFFMVRVAGLKRRIAAGVAVRAASGLLPREVLDSIWATTTE